MCVFGGCWVFFNCLNKYINKICLCICLLFPPGLCGTADERNSNHSAAQLVAAPRDGFAYQLVQIYITAPRWFDHFRCSFIAQHEELKNLAGSHTELEQREGNSAALHQGL